MKEDMVMTEEEKKDKKKHAGKITTAFGGCFLSRVSILVMNPR